MMNAMNQYLPEPPADTVVVLDFETTGLSPTHGDRAIEIGAVLIEQGQIKDRFQQLMNPGFRISAFIEQYTGITNQMLKKAPPCEEVMAQFADFIGNHNLVAHNASFDQRFLDAELRAVNRRYGGSFACSMLISRRVYPEAPNHKLGSLVAYKNLPTDGVFHRALADSEMTAQLWLRMLEDIRQRYPIPEMSFPLMQQLSRQTKGSVHQFLSKRCGTSLANRA